MRKLLVAVAVVAVALVGTPARGHEVINRDPNDTAGEFDILWTKFDHTQTKVILKTKVTGELQKSDFGPLVGGVSQNFFAWRLIPGSTPGLITPAGDPDDYEVYMHAKRVDGERVVNCYLFDNDVELDKYPPTVLGDQTATCRVELKDIAGLPRRWQAGSSKGSNTDLTDLKGTGHNA